MPSGTILPGYLVKLTVMTSGLIILIIAAVALGLIYLMLHQFRKTRDKGPDKLINRNIPPYSPDDKEAGGGLDEFR